jgi:predicted RNA-binding Zn-ribbon protein involved in translation (DUF1610 family)
MNGNKSIEIICPACGQEALLRRKPLYEGFKRISEELACAGCGYVFPDEKSIPFKERPKSNLFNPADLDAKPEVFKAGETGRLCRHCAHYVVNPFIQRCALQKKEVEATDSCGRFKAREKQK